MIFPTFEGQLLMAYHSPNGQLQERRFFLPLQEVDSALVTSE